MLHGVGCRFNHARVAGLMAFGATHKYLTSMEVAAKVFPCVVPLSLDADAGVRKQALALCKTLLARLENGYNGVLLDLLRPAHSCGCRSCSCCRRHRRCVFFFVFFWLVVVVVVVAVVGRAGLGRDADCYADFGGLTGQLLQAARSRD